MLDLFTPQAKPLTLRPYQAEAVQAVYDHLGKYKDNPCVVIPTGGGKTPVIAKLCADMVKQWKARVLVLSHVKELLEQSAATLARSCPDIPVGLYSAGLGKRETKQPVIVAGVQSIYKRICELDPFDLAIIDEAHLIPPDGEGMYRQLFTDMRAINPRVRFLGLTATPFRLQSGAI